MKHKNMNIYFKQFLEGRIIFLAIVLTYFIVLIWVFRLRPKSISEVFSVLGYGGFSLLWSFIGV